MSFQPEFFSQKSEKLKFGKFVEYFSRKLVYPYKMYRQQSRRKICQWWPPSCYSRHYHICNKGATYIQSLDSEINSIAELNIFLWKISRPNKQAGWIIGHVVEIATARINAEAV